MTQPSATGYAPVSEMELYWESYGSGASRPARLFPRRQRLPEGCDPAPEPGAQAGGRVHPCRREGWFPEILAAFDQMGSAGFDQMKHSPMYAAWTQVAPDPDAFPTLMDKTGELQRRPYDWSDQIRGLTVPTLLVVGDADSIPVSHTAEFFALLGGGLRDAGWDRSARPESRLAILPGLTHYDIFQTPQLAQVVNEFFGC